MGRDKEGTHYKKRREREVEIPERQREWRKRKRKSPRKRREERQGILDQEFVLIRTLSVINV